MRECRPLWGYVQVIGRVTPRIKGHRPHIHPRPTHPAPTHLNRVNHPAAPPFPNTVRVPPWALQDIPLQQDTAPHLAPMHPHPDLQDPPTPTPILITLLPLVPMVVQPILEPTHRQDMARPPMGTAPPADPRLLLLLQHPHSSPVRVGTQQQQRGLCRALLRTLPRSQPPKPGTQQCQARQLQLRMGLLQMSRQGRNGASGSSRRRLLLAG